MPHDLYRLQLIHGHTHRTFPGERLWTVAQLLQPATIRFLRVRNRDGYDIYIHPDAWDQNAGYILVDLDHADANVVDRMRHNGHQPCLKPLLRVLNVDVAGKARPFAVDRDAARYVTIRAAGLRSAASKRKTWDCSLVRGTADLFDAFR